MAVVRGVKPRKVYIAGKGEMTMPSTSEKDSRPYKDVTNTNFIPSPNAAPAIKGEQAIQDFKAQQAMVIAPNPQVEAERRLLSLAKENKVNQIVGQKIEEQAQNIPQNVQEKSIEQKFQEEQAQTDLMKVAGEQGIGLQKEKIALGAEGLSNFGVVRTTLGTTAAIVEAIGKSVGLDIGKKSVGVTNAEQIYTDYVQTINSQIDSGSDLATVQASIDEAISATNKLEQEAHGLGRLSLRYWLDEGKGIEAQVKKQIQVLSELQAKARLKNLQKSYGI